MYFHILSGISSFISENMKELAVHYRWCLWLRLVPTPFLRGSGWVVKKNRTGITSRGDFVHVINLNAEP